MTTKTDNSVPVAVTKVDNVFWTTLDETMFARHKYYDKRDIDGLRSYIHVCQCRRWYGPGMQVDPATVILQAMDWLNDLLGPKK